MLCASAAARCYCRSETEWHRKIAISIYSFVGFCQHREIRTAFRLCLSSDCYFVVAGAFSLAVLPFVLFCRHGALNSIQLAVRLPLIDSSVSGILIPAFCLAMTAQAEAMRKSNERHTTDSNRNMLFQLSLMHYKWKSNFQYLQKMENDCRRATFSTSEKRVCKTMVAHFTLYYLTTTGDGSGSVLLRIEKR